MDTKWTVMKDPAGNICKVDLSKFTSEDLKSREEAGWAKASAEETAKVVAYEKAQAEKPENLRSLSEAQFKAVTGKKKGG